MYKFHDILSLAVAAYRINDHQYVKECEKFVQNADTAKDCIWPNKHIMLFAINPLTCAEERFFPPLVTITETDLEIADQIIKFFQTLTFRALDNDLHSFDTRVYQLSQQDEIELKDFGVLAYVPAMFFKDYAKRKVKKACRKVDSEYLGEEGNSIFDLDSEILEVKRSQNYDAWNITAVIDNKLASWMSSREIKLGPAVIVKAKIKQHTHHLQYGTPLTRLHYVYAAQ